jgi:hypothetical protein
LFWLHFYRPVVQDPPDSRPITPADVLPRLRVVLWSIERLNHAAIPQDDVLRIAQGFPYSGDRRICLD